MSRESDRNQDHSAEPAATSPCAAVLVVDDNPLIVDVLRGLLKAENFQVFTSPNGSDALSVLANKKVDVIVCDVMMPKMGGYELHENVRRNADYAHIPFIFLTALDDRSEIRQGKEAGADDYLVKPFDPIELVSVVKGKVARSKNLQNLSEQRYDSYRRRVIHTLSHEFRTPLVAINTGMELLIDQVSQQGTPVKSKGLLDAVRRGGQRLERLVNDFMILQQIDAGIAKRQFEAKSRPVKAIELVRKFLRNKEENYTSLGATLTVTDQSSDAMVDVYEAQLIDCLDRLVSNAVKFSPREKEVEIHLYRVEQHISIDIKDRGIGLDPKKLDEAIDVFGQIDRERLEQQGGGLGLSIASHFIMLNSGRLEFEARPGGGSTVAIILPIAPVAAAAE
jgi:two-component system, sensor histidine kinase and response regulator